MSKTSQSTYKPEYAKQAFKYFAEQYGDKMALGSLFNVTHKTILTWERENPEFADSIQKGMQKKLEWLNEIGTHGLKSKDKSFNIDLWRYTMSAVKRQIKCFDKLDFTDPVRVMETLIAAAISGQYPLAINEVKAMLESIAKISDSKILTKMDDLEDRIEKIKKLQAKLER